METTENPPLTPEQQAQIDEWLAWQAAHPYGDQDENGIDLSAIRENLRRTPTERLIRLQQAANALMELDRAIKRVDRSTN